MNTNENMEGVEEHLFAHSPARSRLVLPLKATRPVNVQQLRIQRQSIPEVI